MISEWIKINIGKDDVPKGDFLISDEYGFISIGHNAFDYYDAKYWFPIPKYPLDEPVITNDTCIKGLFK